MLRRVVTFPRILFYGLLKSEAPQPSFLTFLFCDESLLPSSHDIFIGRFHDIHILWWIVANKFLWFLWRIVATKSYDFLWRIVATKFYDILGWSVATKFSWWSVMIRCFQVSIILIFPWWEVAPSSHNIPLLKPQIMVWSDSITTGMILKGWWH